MSLKNLASALLIKPEETNLFDDVNNVNDEQKNHDQKIDTIYDNQRGHYKSTITNRYSMFNNDPMPVVQEECNLDDSLFNPFILQETSTPLVVKHP